MKVEVVEVGYLKENCYILSNLDECLIIDPGDEIEKIEDKINSKKIIGILLTHSHFDHIGAVNSLVSKYNVCVYDFKNLDEGNKKLSSFEFDVIYNPGHTDDSISFYFKKDKLMFVGDFIFKDTIGRCDLSGGNFNKMKESINKIKEYSDDIKIYPGHGEETTLGYEKKNNSFFR